jgi:hypothetical protein
MVSFSRHSGHVMAFSQDNKPVSVSTSPVNVLKTSIPEVPGSILGPGDRLS